MVYEVRQLQEQDGPAAWRLGSIAFGFHATAMPEKFGTAPGRVAWGAFDGDRLIAKAVDRAQGQWFGGRIVPTAGVAGVAVAPEVRRGGLGRQVLTRLLAGARDRGAAISALFPSTPYPYRRLGWEEVGALTYLSVPTSALAAVRPGPGVTLRPATADDVRAVRGLYREWARAGTGMMERSGLLYDTAPEELLAAFDGVTVAVNAEGAIDGYATWVRGPDSDPVGRVTAHDLVAATQEALCALLAMFGGWASVAPVTVLRLGAGDPALLEIPTTLVTEHSRQPWMLRLVDAPAAIAARGWPGHLSGAVDLALADPECPWNAGAWRLVLDGGIGRLEPGGSGGTRFTPRGLAVWYAGAATPAVLRRAGLLAGDAVADGLLAAATAGPVPVLHDFF
ncbi:GNAT family N-acetyltransferase [Catellatospora sichuanensis]|uniref:GNAT family N-acetyltransferase n=1 Tax=Catellatospora sichuanensis TaxID=1969805 RepID=UPI00118202A3|nr:GNAT family N-acetyltransferase [Catellatospora sichuanensis]